MKKEEIVDKIIDDLIADVHYEKTYPAHTAYYQLDFKKMRKALLKAFEQQHKEILEMIPKKYNDKKLGSTDLTSREWFERGYNSCIAQVINKINSIK